MGLTKHATSIAMLPLKVAGRAVGLARGTAVAATQAVLGRRSDDPERDLAASTGPETSTVTPPAEEPRTRTSGDLPTPADLAERVAPSDDVPTPAGTTGAGAGHNPDTAETGLEQPGTEPLMDPATTRSVASEADTLRRAADVDKG